MQEQTSKKENPSANKWVKRFGFAGFMFFFIKGLMWLIVPAVIAYFAW